jgi:DNA-binding NtrC family response regulator
MLKALAVESDRYLVLAMIHMFQASEVDVTWARDKDTASEILDLVKFDVLILDNNVLGSERGKDIGMMRKKAPGAPVVLVTDGIYGPTDQDTTRAGDRPYDYVLAKPIRADRVRYICDDIRSHGDDHPNGRLVS